MGDEGGLSSCLGIPAGDTQPDSAGQGHCRWEASPRASKRLGRGPPHSHRNIGATSLALKENQTGGKSAFLHVFAPEDLPVPLACFCLQQHGAQKEWGRLSPRATLDGPGDHVLQKVSGPHFPAPPKELFQDHPHLQEGAPLCWKSSTHSHGSQVGSLGR